jgi:hypothetical protein
VASRLGERKASVHLGFPEIGNQGNLNVIPNAGIVFCYRLFSGANGRMLRRSQKISVRFSPLTDAAPGRLEAAESSPDLGNMPVSISFPAPNMQSHLWRYVDSKPSRQYGKRLGTTISQQVKIL